MAYRRKTKSSKKWPAKVILLLTSTALLLLLPDCTKKTPAKVSPHFQVYVPLEEDYPLLKRGIFSIIELSFPRPNITLREGLSDSYQIAPFEDWISRADPDAILRLQIRVERAEDMPHVLTFLNKDDLRFPFKVKVPSPESEGSEVKGESLFCRSQPEGRDILELQLCKELVQSVCPKDVRAATRKFANLAPAKCRLQQVPSDPAEASRTSPKLFLLSGFPLPIKVKNDYPLTRFAEVDENLLLSLFGPE